MWGAIRKGSFPSNFQFSGGELESGRTQTPNSVNNTTFHPRHCDWICVLNMETIFLSLKKIQSTRNMRNDNIVSTLEESGERSMVAWTLVIRPKPRKYEEKDKNMRDGGGGGDSKC